MSDVAKALDTLAKLSGGELQAGDEAAGRKVRVTSVGIVAQDVDSRGLFAAVPGEHTHGAKWAKKSPAAAIVTDIEGAKLLAEAKERRPVIVVEDVRAVLGPISAAIYGRPSEKLTVIGVTGTSGKTTVSYLIEAGLMNAGYTVGLIGTTGTRIGGADVETKLTTPEAPVLQELFSRMLDEGVSHVVMEVSSHALTQGRVNGTDFDVAAFTNLSQDHLDYHKTMEEYFDAKSIFFKPGSVVRAKKSVICVDGAWGQQMAVVAGPAAITVSTGPRPAMVRVSEPELTAEGTQTFEVHLKSGPVAVEVPLPGRFNVANAALAVTAAVTTGVDAEKFAAGLHNVVVPGRMQAIDCGQNFTVVVDYAHKPAAIAAVLDTLRAQTTGRIGIVLGAGGNRDHGKRPLMGQEAAERAELVIVTDDNPRDEDPDSIRAEVLQGAKIAAKNRKTPQVPKPGSIPRTQSSGAAEVKSKKVKAVDIREIGDRAAAIAAACRWAREGDAILIAGKGHETGQIIGENILPFDDRDVTRRVLCDLADGGDASTVTGDPGEGADVGETSASLDGGGRV